MADTGVDKLLSSKKYRDVCPDTLRRVWEDCSRKYKKPKDVDRAAREALHGITGAFLTPDEARECAWAMHAWATGRRTDAQLVNMLNKHASTRERLPIEDMDALFERIFAVTGKPASVLDLACGIDPLYLGARGLPTTGVDISGAAVSLINAFGQTYGAPVKAMCADLLCAGGIPAECYDVALLFKILPLLERQQSGAALRVLSAIHARHIVASFPTRTLGGRNVGMAAHYADWMDANLPEGMAVVDRFETANELFYILESTHD